MSLELSQLIKVGLHYGHQTARSNPRMAPYVWGHRAGVHLIDVSKTAHGLEKAAQFLESLAAHGKMILWVGTKKAAQKAIQNAGVELQQPAVVYRWIGGTLTNFTQVKKSVTKLLHLEDVIEKAELFPYTKKELNIFNKSAERLVKNIGGIRTLRWPVGAIVVIDVNKEHTAVREAAVSGVPVVALVDTNCDPSMVDWVIPGNDDSPNGIEFVVSHLVDAVKRGRAAYDAGAVATAEQSQEPVIESDLARQVALAEATDVEEARKVVAGAPQAKTAQRRGGPVGGRRPTRGGGRPGPR